MLTSPSSSRWFALVLLCVCPLLLAEEVGFIRETDESEIREWDVQAFLDDNPVVRYRIVEIDGEYLRDFIHAENGKVEAEEPGCLRFPLFGELSPEFCTVKTTIFDDGLAYGNSFWLGGFERGLFYGADMHVDPNNRVWLWMNTPDGQYHIRATDYPPYHIFWELDRSIYEVQEDE